MSGSFHFGIISSVKDKAEEIKEEKEKQEQETQRDSIPVDNLPTISITSPADGSSVFATVTVTVNTTDDQGITKVEFYVDGTLKETDTTSPYSYSWDTTQYSNTTQD